MDETYYDVLGITPNATKAEIKDAFRELVKHWHPDINPSAEAQAMMQRINEAYNVLNDSKMRAEYDYWLYCQSQQIPYTDNDTSTSYPNGSYTPSPNAASPKSDDDSFPWYYTWVAMMLAIHLFRACSQM